MLTSAEGKTATGRGTDVGGLFLRKVLDGQPSVLDLMEKMSDRYGNDLR